MRIAMFTNTYVPHVGGVARSVERFTRTYRRAGHAVLVVAPEYAGQPAAEEGVHRVPALRRFYDTDFSLALPVGTDLSNVLADFSPEIAHAHHPFMLGNSALRAAASHDVPVVFTHHTMYEHYTHYVPVHAQAVRTYAIRLATGFANLCDRVIAPSESVADILKGRGVTTPIHVVPTGVDLERFATGDGEAFRSEAGIPAAAPLIGYVGRLAPEKNLSFLARAVAECLTRRPEARFVAIGRGPAQQEMEAVLRHRGLGDRAHFPGVRKGRQLVDAYHAMTVFAFASKTETQGMVLVEALASGCPVVALDAPGVREVTRDGQNGRLVSREDEALFAAAVEDLLRIDEAARRALGREAAHSARPFAAEACARRTLDLYEEAVREGPRKPARLRSGQSSPFLRALKREWELWTNRVSSVAQAITELETDETADTGR